jgi:hypothetical protein
MDSLLWLEEEKSNCKGKWIDKNLFPVGEKTKGTCNFQRVIRIVISQKDRQHNDQRKRTNIDLKAIHIKLFKDRVTRTPLKTGSELTCPGRVKQ